jgi:hypothetical protein
MVKTPSPANSAIGGSMESASSRKAPALWDEEKFHRIAGRPTIYR